VIAIDHNRNILRNTVVSQRALDLGYQESIVSTYQQIKQVSARCYEVMVVS
jgi:hypothetical protein